MFKYLCCCHRCGLKWPIRLFYSTHTKFITDAVPYRSAKLGFFHRSPPGWGKVLQSPALSSAGGALAWAVQIRTLYFLEVAVIGCETPGMDFCIKQNNRHCTTKPQDDALARQKVLLYCGPLPSTWHNLSYDVCLEDKRENYRNCSVLCCVRQLCTMIHTHIWAILKDLF